VIDVIVLFWRMLLTS